MGIQSVKGIRAKRAVCALAAGLAMAAAGFAQTISSVRVVTEPPGRFINVDGQTYAGPVTFFWPAGSKHVLYAEPEQEDIRAQTLYKLGGWTNNLGVVDYFADGRTFQVTADPKLTEIKASFSTLYQVIVSYYDCPEGTPQAEGCPGSPGTVTVGGQRFGHNGKIYLNPGAVSLSAQPNKGWVFVGFGASANPDSTTFVGQIRIIQPTVIYPRFAMAREIRISSNPAGLEIFADRAPVRTPFNIEWGRGTVHLLGVPEVQQDRTGKLWLFGSWSTGQPQTHEYSVPQGEPPIDMAVTFVRGERVTIQSAPAGLPIEIDGRSNWTAPTFSWAVGSKHMISAPEKVKDARGRIWVFKGWSNGGTAAQEITVPDNAGQGSHFTATYEVRSAITIQSTMPGTVFTVDGNSCASPCVLETEVGNTVQVEAPASIPAGAGSRVVLASWDPGAGVGATRSIEATADPQLVTAVYKLQHLLSVSSDPAGGASFRSTPSSADGYYDAETSVQVTANVNLGYRFSYWDGDASANDRTVNVEMFGPKSIRVVLNRVPTVPKGGVRSAADPNLENVAAGSAISIFGASLAGEPIVGPENPLVQTLGDVTVRLGSSYLPLYFVSPDQINALLPADVPEGPNQLFVRWEGHPETQADFTVVRNAPAIFQNILDGQSYGLVLNSKGIPVTPAAPALRGETVTILATGLSPTVTAPPLGFGVAETPNYRLADTTEVLLGAEVLVPAYAGAAENRPGIQAVRFQIGAQAPTGSVELQVRVNGVSSNRVLLPIQ